MRRWVRQLPNLISSIRILVIVPIAVALARRQTSAALWLFGIAAASDAMDGYLAKRFGWQTDLGGILDPIADKLLMATVFVMLTLLGSVPPWLTKTVIARDCIIALGAMSYRFLLGPLKARPSRVSKLNMLCQAVFVLAIVAEPRFSWLRAWIMPLGALVFVTVAVSGIDYVMVYGRLAASQARSRQRVARSGGSKPA